MEQLRFPVTKKEAEKAGIKYSAEANKNALFPSRLRALREEKGVSQAGLAAVLGVSKSTIGLYETGDTLPDIKTADELADYFGISTDYLLGRTDVRSCDIQIQSVCSYTGLSEDTIEQILYWKDDDREFLHFLDQILLSGSFHMLMYHAENYRECIRAEEIYWKLKEDFALIERGKKNKGLRIRQTFDSFLNKTVKEAQYPKEIKSKILAEHKIWNDECQNEDLDESSECLRDSLVDVDGFSLGDIYEYRASKDLSDLLEEIRNSTNPQAETYN